VASLALSPCQKVTRIRSQSRLLRVWAALSKADNSERLRCVIHPSSRLELLQQVCGSRSALAHYISNITVGVVSRSHSCPALRCPFFQLTRTTGPRLNPTSIF
jgi:hypothetical protein